MDDLISRQAAIEHCKKRLYETSLNNVMNGNDYLYQEIADNRIETWLNELPSAQRTGRWIIDRDSTGCMYGRCTSCGMKQYEGRTKYCPNCGARMEEQE